MDDAPTEIYLSPIGEDEYGDGRIWCEDNQWGEDGVKYIRVDSLSKMVSQEL